MGILKKEEVSGGGGWVVELSIRQRCNYFCRNQLGYSFLNLTYYNVFPLCLERSCQITGWAMPSKDGLNSKEGSTFSGFICYFTAVETPIQVGVLVLWRHMTAKGV